MERRSLVIKGRPFRVLAWKMIGCTVLGLIVLVLTSSWLPNWAGFLVAATLLFGIGFYQTSRGARIAVSITANTPCPQCGKWPMQFVPKAGSEDRSLLVCENCQIEWDLGQT